MAKEEARLSVLEWKLRQPLDMLRRHPVRETGANIAIKRISPTVVIVEPDVVWSFANVVHDVDPLVVTRQADDMTRVGLN